MRNLYEIMGIDRDATPQAVRKAYRKRVAEVHPDKPSGSREAYDELAIAYEVLSDPMRRVKYDATGDHGDHEADNVVSELIGTLASIFNQVMGEIAARGLDAERQNFTTLMILCAESALVETAKPRENFIRSRDTLEKLVGRFDVLDDETPNHMATIIRGQLIDIDRKLIPIDKALASLRASKLYLQGCKFKKLEPMSLTSGIFTASTVFTTLK